MSMDADDEDPLADDIEPQPEDFGIPMKRGKEKTMAFKKAIKSQAKLRAALFGPSGAGKTYTALEIGTGITSVIGGKIALIDSERSSASKYADRFEFDQVDLEVKDIDEYVKFIKEAAAAGYSVLIIDSLSHAWQMLLDSVEKLAQAKYRGNTWSAWSEGTPEQRKLVDSIVSFPGHVIATMRSKTEWQTATNDKGKSAPVRVGLAPEQGKGIEYEFDILFEITPDHLAHIIKDRSGKFQDKIINKPDRDFGKNLVNWLNEGAVPPPSPSLPSTPPSVPKKPAEDYKSVLDEIGIVLRTESSGERIFSDAEQTEVSNMVKENLAKISKDRPDLKLAYLTDILDKQKKLLNERMRAAKKDEAATPSMYMEPETPAGEEQAQSEDHFEDDIPWGDGKDQKAAEATNAQPDIF